MSNISNSNSITVTLILCFSIAFSYAHAQDTTNLSSTCNADALIFEENDPSLEYRFLTSRQARDVLAVIGKCKEIVLYCGHADEVETYMVLCDYWKEKVIYQERVSIFDPLFGTETTTTTEPPSNWYEIWVLGYDLHTGDSICTPIDPYCIWFYKDGAIHNAGAYVFKESVPWVFPFNWNVPQYTLINCLHYAKEMQPTYHYYIHVFGYYVPVEYRPSPPYYYKDMKRIKLPNAGHDETLTNSSSSTVDQSDSTSGSSSTVNQNYDNLNHQENIGRHNPDTIQLQKTGEIRQPKEQQLIDNQKERVNHQQTGQAREGIEQQKPQQAEQEKPQRQQEEQARQQAEQQKDTTTAGGVNPAANGSTKGSMTTGDASTATNPITSPTTTPTTTPTTNPTTSPITSPTTKPTTNPTTKPTTNPTTSPTTTPTTTPTTRPTTSPTTTPTTRPAASPTTSPTTRPAASPTTSPTTNGTTKDTKTTGGPEVKKGRAR